MDCELCSEAFDLIEHQPMRLGCGHVFCKQCIQNMIEHNSVAKCSTCQNTDRRDLDKIPLANDLIITLQNRDLYCSEHEARATGYSSTLIRPICELCNLASVEQRSIPILITRNLYHISMHNKHLFSKELRLIIRSLMKERLQLQCDITSSIKLYVTKGNKCTLHPNQDAISINTTKFTLACLSCHDDRNKKFELNNVNQYIKYYLDDFAYRKQRIDLVFSRITRFIRNNDEYLAQPFIELFLMEKYFEDDYSRYGCLSCGKLFHLGMQMPVLLRCGHLLCFKCSLSVSNCDFCGQGVIVATLKPIEKLYTMALCARCQHENGVISNENLPFHGVCDCILCARCIKSSNCCRKCIPEGVTRDQYDMKINRRALKACHYLNTNVICDACFSTKAFYFINFPPYRVLCQSCNQSNQSVILLTNYYQLETFLLNFESHIANLAAIGNYPAYYYVYAGLPLALKMHIIAGFYNENIRSMPIEYPLLRIQELRRFKKIFPVSNIDSRKYIVTQGQYIGLGLYTNIPIKLCGVMLGGRVDLGDLNMIVYVLDSASKLIKQTSQISAVGKEVLVMLENIPQSTILQIIICYSGNYSLFCGKLAQTNIIEQGGITWQLIDPYQKNNEFCGPILGILYSQDF